MTSPALENVPDSAKRTDKKTVFSWAMWDWGSAAFNAVLVTFIFAVYLTDSVGAQIDTSRTPAQWLSVAMTVAGLAIFAVTPIMGQRSDTRGTHAAFFGVVVFHHVLIDGRAVFHPQ